MDLVSFINNSDPQIIEDLYQQYKVNPDSVDGSWQEFFAGFEFATKQYPVKKSVGKEPVSEEFNVIRLITAYRERGHLFSKTNPVFVRKVQNPTLDIEHYGLKPEHLNQIGRASCRERVCLYV